MPWRAGRPGGPGDPSGSFGRNRFTARVTVRDGHLTLGSPKATRTMCDVSLMAIEKTPTVRLARPPASRLDHRTITLTSENDEGVQAVAER
ncbi:META domain-containing protein [Streptomyces sp. NPDC002513]